MQGRKLEVSATITVDVEFFLSDSKRRRRTMMGEILSKGRPPRGSSPSQPRKEYLEGRCRKYKPKTGCNFGEECLPLHEEAGRQPKRTMVEEEGQWLLECEALGLCISRWGAAERHDFTEGHQILETQTVCSL